MGKSSFNTSSSPKKFFKRSSRLLSAAPSNRSPCSFRWTRMCPPKKSPACVRSPARHKSLTSVSRRNLPPAPECAVNNATEIEIEKDLVRWPRPKWVAVVLGILVLQGALLFLSPRQLPVTRVNYRKEPVVSFVRFSTPSEWLELQD